MIGNEITATVISFALIGCLAMSTGAYLKGRYDGITLERASWTVDVDSANKRADNSETNFKKGAAKVPAVIERETKTIIKYDDAAIRKVAKLEEQIEDLKWELKNDKTTGVCTGNIPAEWVRQQQKLDRILQGVSETSQKGSHKSKTFPFEDYPIIPFPVRD